MSKAYWSAVGAYLIPTFPLGYVWHLVTFHEQYDRLQVYRDDIIIPLGLASMLVQAFVFAWLYPRMCSTRRADWRAGAVRFFLVAGALAWSFTTLPVAAKYRMTSVAHFMVLETAFTLVQFAVISPLIALASREEA